MIRLHLAIRYFLRHKLSRDDKRNLRLGGTVSLYGLSFAFEKGFIVLQYPLGDEFWFFAYTVLSILSIAWWLEDSILDLWEKHTTEDDEMDAHLQRIKELKEKYAKLRGTKENN